MAAQTMLDKQRMIISNLEKRMKSAKLPVRESAGKPNHETDVTSVVFDEVGLAKTEICGQMMFLPDVEEEVGIMNGVVSYILADHLNPESAVKMKFAINHVNAHLPMGGFCLDPTDTMLIYRHTFAVYEDTHEEQIIEMFMMHLNIGYELVLQWLDALIGLDAGIFTLEEVFHFK